MLQQFLRVSRRLRKVIQRSLKGDGAKRVSERAEPESELVDSEGDQKELKGPASHSMCNLLCELSPIE